MQRTKLPAWIRTRARFYCLPVLGDIVGKRFRLLRWMLPFRGLSVSFMHCAQKAENIDKISFTYDRPMFLPHRAKIWLTSVNPFLPKFCPKVPC